MRRLALAALIGCGGASKPAPAAIDNKLSASPSEAAPVQAECKLAGVVIDVASAEPAIGATIVVSGAMNEEVGITEEDGSFKITVQPGHDRMTFYFNNQTVEHRLEAAYCGRRLRIPFANPALPIVVE